MKMVCSKNTYCLYMHTNKNNNKKYIGITSKPPKKRWENGSGYVGCRHFYSAIQKYGWDSFEHKILYSGLTEKQANDLEIEMISKYKSNDRRYGYNIASGGYSGCLGLNNNPRKSHEVFQYSIDGTFITNYPSISEAYRCTGVDISSIASCARGQKSFAGGFIWKDKYFDHVSPIDIDEFNKRRASWANKPVYQYNLDGEFINSYSSLTSAKEITNIDNESIASCCKGKARQAGGYIWTYDYFKNVEPTLPRYARSAQGKINSAKFVAQYDNDWNLIRTYKSARIAAKEIGINEGTLRGALCKATHYALGYRFTYISVMPGEDDG